MTNIHTIKLFLTEKIFSYTLVKIFSFTLLTILSAQIIIPVKPVPFTLQTMIVVLSGASLGKKNGMLSQMIYLMLGVMGLPVFAPIIDGGIGIARLFGPTGGYLLAFPISAFITGLIVEKYKSYFAVAASMFVGNLIVILFGAFYLDVFFIKNISESFKVGALLFSIWTVIKVFLSTSIYFLFKSNK